MSAPLTLTTSTALPSDFIPFPDEALEQSIPALFEPQVRRHADRLAVRSRHHQFSYAALNEAANRIAHALLAQRGEGEEPVGLLFAHGAPVIAAIMGVLKAGKIYVPLDPATPRARTEYILADAGARVIVTDREHLPLARALAPPGVALIDWEALDTATTDPGLTLSPNTLALLLYTSGSTGKPKGVIQDHRHLLDEIWLAINHFRIGPQDRILLERSCGFSAAARRIFPALLTGASLFPIDLLTDGVLALPGWLAQEGITISGGLDLLRRCEDALTGPDQFPHLRLLIFGGDTIYRTDFERFQQYLPDACRMVVNLASTEGGIISRFFLDKETQFAGGVIPAGWPVERKTVRLLDEAGQPVPDGEIGEIMVQGPALFRGYWRRPDLTEAVLQPVGGGADKDRAGAGAGARAGKDGTEPGGNGEWVFRTGDLGRRLPDGCLMHQGRQDFQIKVRGYRIEAGEVEMALRALPGIREATVTAHQDRAGDTRLVAYLVPVADGQWSMVNGPDNDPVGLLTPPASRVPGQQPLTISELRRSLAARLPEYMIPAACVFLDELPRTATGKVDRKALPPPPRVRPALEAAYVPPCTPIEQALVEAWAAVLELDEIGIHDPFLELGGNSLLATRILARLREALGVELPQRALFEHPTVAALAVTLTEILAQQSQPDDLQALLTEMGG